jgi:hypothetical protein
MFASNVISNAATAPITMSVIDSAVVPCVPEHQQVAASENVGASQLWLSKEPAITLRRCGDGPALEYGCVDWFLYDKQRPQ